MKILVIYAGIWFLLAACSPAAAPAAKPSVAQAPAQPTAPVAPARQAAEPAARPAPVEQIKVSFAATTAVYAPWFIAMEKGYLAEEGLEMEIVRAGGGAATPALLSGDIHYSTSAASSVSATMKGAPMKVIFTHADRPLDELWSATPEIRTLADLRGKLVGVQTRGDTMEIETRIVLMQNDIDPNAVGFSAVGVGGQRLAALQAGAVAAAILPIAEVVEMQDALRNGHRLASIREEVQMLYMGLATTDQELQTQRDRARRFLRAVIKGREYFKAFRDESVQILTKYNQSPRSVNEFDYDVTLPALTEDGSISVEVQRRDTALRAEINALEEVPAPEQIYDYSLTREVYGALRGSGWRPVR